MPNRWPPAVDDAIGVLEDRYPDMTQLTVEPLRGKWLVIAKRNNRPLQRIEVPCPTKP
jgi:hypothetical protein